MVPWFLSETIKFSLLARKCDRGLPKSEQGILVSLKRNGKRKIQITQLMWTLVNKFQVLCLVLKVVFRQCVHHCFSQLNTGRRSKSNL